MPSKDELKQRVCEAIDRHGNEIIAIGEEILHHPETGFNEHKTSKLVAEAMAGIGLSPQTGLALTGVKGRIAGHSAGPRVAIVSELDSLRTSDHPLADPHTGAAHSCGHNAQIAGMLGAAMGLNAIGAAQHLAGEMVFFSVPAEVVERLHAKNGLLVKTGQEEPQLPGPSRLCHELLEGRVHPSVTKRDHSTPLGALSQSPQLPHAGHDREKVRWTAPHAGGAGRRGHLAAA